MLTLSELIIKWDYPPKVCKRFTTFGTYYLFNNYSAFKLYKSCQGIAFNFSFSLVVTIINNAQSICRHFSFQPTLRN